jgi:hypothetical protein
MVHSIYDNYDSRVIHRYARRGFRLYITSPVDSGFYEQAQKIVFIYDRMDFNIKILAQNYYKIKRNK